MSKLIIESEELLDTDKIYSKDEVDDLLVDVAYLHEPAEDEYNITRTKPSYLNPREYYTKGGADATFARKQDVGDVALLQTVHKATTVAAINEVNTKVKDINGTHFEIVEERPATGMPNTIYLVPVQGQENVYQQWLYNTRDGQWYSLGTTEIDLSNYYTKEEADAEFINTNEIVTGITSASTDTEVPSAKAVYDFGQDHVQKRISNNEVYYHSGETQGALNVITAVNSSSTDAQSPTAAAAYKMAKNVGVTNLTVTYNTTYVDTGNSALMAKAYSNGIMVIKGYVKIKNTPTNWHSVFTVNRAATNQLVFKNLMFSNLAGGDVGALDCNFTPSGNSTIFNAWTAWNYYLIIDIVAPCNGWA